MTTMIKKKRTILGTAMAGLGMQSMSTMMLSFVLATMIQEFGLNGIAGGFISTITNLGMLLGGVLFGTLADRRGRRITFVITVFIFSISTGLMAFATNITHIYILRFLVGVGGGGEYGVIMSLIADNFSKEQRGRINSFVTISGQFGSIVAAIAAAWIMPSLGWRALFAFGAIPIFLAIYAHFTLTESQEWRASVANKKPSISELFTQGRAPITIKLTIMAIAQVAGYFGLMNWLPSILQKKIGLTVSGSSYWMIVTIVGMSLGMIVFGQIMDKLGAKKAYASFLIASALAVFAYSFANTSTTILFGGALIGFFCNGMNAGYGAIVGNLYPTRIRATANNIIFNVGRAVGGFSSVCIGYFLDNFSLTIAMAFLSILYIVSLTCVLTLNINQNQHQ